MNKTVVAVIDNGVNEGPFSISAPNYYVEITSDLQVIKRKQSISSIPSHGTICASIISKYAPQAEIVSIKITKERTQKASAMQLIKALEWCTDNGIRLVNLSMGTVDYREYYNISYVINNLSANGLIIVAAYNNYNIYTCPASLPCVFGVKSAKNGYLTGNQFIIDTAIPDDNSNFIACSCVTLSNCFGNTFCLPSSNSFATPIITAAICNMLSSNPILRFGQIMKMLNVMSLDKHLPVNAIHQVLPPNTFSSPAIAVCGMGISSLHLACSIQNLLIKDGYNAPLFAESEFVGMAGKEYVVIPLEYVYNMGEKCIKNETLSIINTVYQPDIFIVFLSERQNKQLGEDLPFDVIVHDLNHIINLECDVINANSNNLFYICSNFSESEHSILAKKYADNLICSIEELYMKIKDMFSVES